MAVHKTRYGTYIARWTDPWGDQVSKSFKYKADADAYYKRMLGDMARGEYTDPKRGRTTLAKWADEWLAGARNLGRGGFDTYRRDLDRHILPVLGKVPVGRLSASDIDRYLTGALTGSYGRGGTETTASPVHGRKGAGWTESRRCEAAVDVPPSGLAPSTVHRHYRTIHRMLEVAVDRGLIVKNPAAKVQPPKVPKRQLTVLTADQIDDLADAISERWRAWVFVAAYGGLRWSETVGLRRGSVDGPVVRVVEQLVHRGRGDWERCEPKAGSRRAVTLPSFAADELATHLATYALAGPDGLVFPTRNGTAPQAPSWTQNTFKRALARAGLPPMRIHDLRHSAVSLAIDVGANPLVSQLRAGHSSPNIHLGTYGHLMAGADQAVADALDDLRAESLRRRLRAV